MTKATIMTMTAKIAKIQKSEALSQDFVGRNAKREWRVKE